MKKLFCPKPWENVLVEVNGDVYFCCFSNRPGGRIGCLQTNGLMEVWGGPTATRIRKEIMAGRIPQSCLDCELFRFEKKSVVSVREAYLHSHLFRALIARSKRLTRLKNRLRRLLFNFANRTK
jgi:radical SAM protein with 4Fe4S-binding SPASM domain